MYIYTQINKIRTIIYKLKTKIKYHTYDVHIYTYIYIYIYTPFITTHIVNYQLKYGLFETIFVFRLQAGGHLPEAAQLLGVLSFGVCMYIHLYIYIYIYIHVCKIIYIYIYIHIHIHTYTHMCIYI